MTKKAKTFKESVDSVVRLANSIVAILFINYILAILYELKTIVSTEFINEYINIISMPSISYGSSNNTSLEISDVTIVSAENTIPVFETLHLDTQMSEHLSFTLPISESLYVTSLMSSKTDITVALETTTTISDETLILGGVVTHEYISIDSSVQHEVFIQLEYSEDIQASSLMSYDIQIGNYVYTVLSVTESVDIIYFPAIYEDIRASSSMTYDITFSNIFFIIEET